MTDLITRLETNGQWIKYYSEITEKWYVEKQGEGKRIRCDSEEAADCYIGTINFD